MRTYVFTCKQLQADYAYHGLPISVVRPVWVLSSIEALRQLVHEASVVDRECHCPGQADSIEPRARTLRSSPKAVRTYIKIQRKNNATIHDTAYYANLKPRASQTSNTDLSICADASIHSCLSV